VVKFRCVLNLTVGFALLLGAGAMGMLAALTAAGQENTPVPGSEHATADTSPQGPAFEVAAIKPNKSGSFNSVSNFKGGRFTATNIDLKTLMQYDAFGVPAAQIMGLPASINSDRFDIEGKVDDTVVAQTGKLSRDQSNRLEHQLIQQLLADRFKLTFHMETKECPVYALVVWKGNPKLVQSMSDEKGPSFYSNSGKLTAKGVTMKELAQFFTQVSAGELGRFVIDKTGLEGKYDLTLAWSPDNRLAAMTDTSNDVSAPPGPSIFTAVQEQLGLKLESTKAPVETLVIDHIEQPSEN
jgi:uncharacterized protein (TIGR03435 family)